MLEMKKRLRMNIMDAKQRIEILEARLKRANIALEDLAKLLMPFLRDEKRMLFLAHILGGLAVRWNGESPQRCAELAERLTDAVMREEDKRS